MRAAFFRRWTALFLLPALFSPSARGQRPEFLTDGEITQIREAQEANDRLKLYVQFAGERLSAVEKALAAADPNRGDLIHDNLREYDRIIDAIDDNVEQSTKNRSLFRKGLEGALKAAPEFLKQLEGFRARNPADLQQYRFILNQAIETTGGSITGLQEALGKQPKGRKEEKEERKKREEDLRLKEQERLQKEQPKAAPAESGPPRKKRG